MQTLRFPCSCPRLWIEEKRALSTGKYTGSSSNHGQNNNGKGPYFTRVARDSATRLINLWPLVRTPYPPSSVNAPFTGIQSYSLVVSITGLVRCLQPKRVVWQLTLFCAMTLETFIKPEMKTNERSPSLWSFTVKREDLHLGFKPKPPSTLPSFQSWWEEFPLLEQSD